MLVLDTIIMRELDITLLASRGLELHYGICKCFISPMLLSAASPTSKLVSNFMRFMQTTMLCKTLRYCALCHASGHIDLSTNPIEDVSALSTLSVLGFVNLEATHVTFVTLAQLRTIKILALRVGKITAAEKFGAESHEYRDKLIALLPCVWILDGDFVTAQERHRAIDVHDGFVSQLLESIGSPSSLLSSLSTSTLWLGDRSDPNVKHLPRCTASCWQVWKKNRHEM